jgi:hypothetical protein
VFLLKVGECPPQQMVDDIAFAGADVNDDLEIDWFVVFEVLVDLDHLGGFFVYFAGEHLNLLDFLVCHFLQLGGL